MMKTSALLLLLLFSTIVAQPKTDSIQCNMRVGLGASVPACGYGGGIGQVGVSLFYKTHVFTAKFIFTEELDFFGQSPNPLQYSEDFGLLYGRQYSTNIFRFSGSAGLSVVNGNLRGHTLLYQETGWFGDSHYNESTYCTVGIPAELCASFIFFEYIELSANFIANLNIKNSYYGASICLGSNTDKMSF